MGIADQTAEPRETRTSEMNQFYRKIISSLYLVSVTATVGSLPVPAQAHAISKCAYMLMFDSYFVNRLAQKVDQAAAEPHARYIDYLGGKTPYSVTQENAEKLKARIASRS